MHHLNLILCDKSCKLFLQPCHTGLEGTSHGVQVYWDERIGVLNEGPMPDLLIQGLHVVIEMDVK